MMRNQREEKELEAEVVEEQLKIEEKKKKRASIERRKNKKKQDKVARFAGFILLLVTMLLGFLMWIVGEMRGGI